MTDVFRIKITRALGLEVRDGDDTGLPENRHLRLGGAECVSGVESARGSPVWVAGEEGVPLVSSAATAFIFPQGRRRIPGPWDDPVEHPKRFGELRRSRGGGWRRRWSVSLLLCFGARSHPGESLAAPPVYPLSGLQSSPEAPVAFAAEMEKVGLRDMGQACPANPERKVSIE
jgi:hypothetical protein